MPAEMALGGKARRRGGLGGAGARGQQVPRVAQAAHQQVAVGAGGIGGAEMPCEGEAAEAGRAFEFHRTHRAIGMRLQIVAGAGGALPGDGARGRQHRAGMVREVAGDGLGQRVAAQFLEALAEATERLQQQRTQRRVVDDGLGHEGQRVRPKRRAQRGGLDIEHAVEQSGCRAGRAVVHLVRMQHQHLARQARAGFATIAERLHAGEGDAERIGVVAMRRVGRAGEQHLDALEPVAASPDHDTAAGGDALPARSFQTGGVPARYGAWFRHRAEFPMFDTKIVIVLRQDLAAWQALNVTFFLAAGIVAQTPAIVGEAYRDREGHVFNPLSIQPAIVLAADAATLGAIHRRALERGVRASAYVEEMFATGHDAANREVFARFGPDDARIVGLALRAEKKIADKIVRGAAMHR